MIAYVLDEQYRDVEKLIAEPTCGEDFCDQCGDCLYCYSEDDCPGQFLHTWVVYADEVADWKAAHPEAKPLAGVRHA